MTDKDSTPNTDTPEADAAGADNIAKKASKKTVQKPAAKKGKPDKASLADLSDFSFGPAWAKEKPKQERSHSPRRNDSEGGGKRPTRKPHQGDRKPGPRGDRAKKFAGKGRRYDQRDRPPVIAAPEGVKARVMPIEKGLDALAKQISDTGRTHSVFELAWVVLGGFERFNMVFESEKEPLYQSSRDQSLWLTKKECETHFWTSGAWKNFYQQEETEVEPPSGNFQSVARCGISRELIGPPNHHAYQQTLMELYHERFSNMPLDRYKQKVVMEHGEEVVQEWLEGMKNQLRWRPLTQLETPSPEAKASEEDKSADSQTAAESAAEAPADSEKAEAPTPEQAPATVEEGAVILSSKQEVSQHFMSHGFENEYKSSKSCYVRANIDNKLLSPPLFVLQKNTVSELRKYPGDLASILCRQMSGRHLAVFKWKKRLHCGPARPKHVPEDLVIADRPKALFKWVIEHPAGEIDAMWKDLLPKEIEEKDRHAWYHDLHWLINEGYVLLFADGKLHAAKELEKPKPQAKKKQPAKKEVPKAAEPKVDEKSADSSAPEEPKK